MAHRHGIKQVTPSGTKESLVAASDNSPYLMLRNLAKNTLKHFCGYETFGFENMRVHIQNCNEVPSEEIDPLYLVENLENCTRKFGFVLQINGYFHYEYNSSMRIHDRLLEKIFGNLLPNMFGRTTDKSIANFWKAGDHHKSCVYMEVVLFAIGFYLLSVYKESSTEVYTPQNYYKWLSKCQNGNVVIAHNLAFGPLLAQMLFRSATRKNDSISLTAAKFELAKIFFMQKSNRNYQSLVAHNLKDLMVLPECWLKRYHSLHVSSQTIRSSVSIPELPADCNSYSLKETEHAASSNTQRIFESTREEKVGMGCFEGVDARLEEVNQISKDAEETIFDEVAWLKDFRMMVPNIKLEKKLLRDQGEDEKLKGSNDLHTRPNYKEIIVLEAKLRQFGWLDNPLDYKEPTTADGTKKLNQESINFWNDASNNMKIGLEELIHEKRVTFQDVVIKENENSDEDMPCIDFEEMKSGVSELLEKLPDDYIYKNLYSDYNKEVIDNIARNSSNAYLVDEFYFILLECVKSHVPIK